MLFIQLHILVDALQVFSQLWDLLIRPQHRLCNPVVDLLLQLLVLQTVQRIGDAGGVFIRRGVVIGEQVGGFRQVDLQRQLRRVVVVRVQSDALQHRRL